MVEAISLAKYKLPPSKMLLKSPYHQIYSFITLVLLSHSIFLTSIPININASPTTEHEGRSVTNTHSQSPSSIHVSGSVTFSHVSPLTNDALRTPRLPINVQAQLQDHPNQWSSGGRTQSSPQTNQQNAKQFDSVDSSSGSSLSYHASPQSEDYAQNNMSQQYRPTNLDAVSEGSGDGPVSPKSHKEKFDDTEEGDDDDEEDYDDKDSGSGHGNEQSPAHKTELIAIQDLNSMRQPSTNEADPYKPFRQPANYPTNNISSLTQETTLQSIRQTTLPTFNVTVPLEMPKISSSSSGMHNFKNYSNQNLPSSPQTELPLVPTQKYSTTPTSVNYIRIDPASNTTERPRQPVTDITTRGQTNPSKDQISPPSLVQPIAIQPVFNSSSKQNFNGSSLSHSKNLSKTRDDVDYDYEDDSDDEDSEDAANFEDNEPLEGDFAVKVANNVTTTIKPLLAPKPESTLRPTSAGVSSTPSKPSVIQTSTTTSIPSTQSSTKFSPPKDLFTTIASTVAISYSSPSPPDGFVENEGEEEEEEEEDEEEDGEEGEMIDEENDEEEEDQLSSTNMGPIISSTLAPSQPRWTSTPKPTIKPNLNERLHEATYNPINSAVPIPITTTTQPPSQPVRPFDYSQPSYRPPVTNPPIKPLTTTLAVLLSTTVAPTPALVPFDPTPFPSSTSTQSTNNRPPISVLSSSASDRSVPIKYTTTPRPRVTPAVTKNSIILAYDRSLADDETGITKQIYDKAVEVYQATSKAIQTAAQAIWPPSFELNSTTFEPLLAQPLLFMLALGAAVMGLVLTMMLVVYIVTYQIQPKDDVSIY